ncbi:hypothetical protein EYC84_011205 [Monilinia fructicola]|uniref:Uncharacterized protein n=1 Tax=Monilinia fructicola TaxID=38448 RepID=A0A5M9J5H1_MONFR|nr:hypothetical protein EYC84_011205 [Monilinia fructicola]
MTTTSSTVTATDQDSNATMEKLTITSEITLLLPSALFLHGSDWDSLNFTPYESKACKIAFDKLSLLAWESVNLSSWRIESELGIISSEWAVKKKAPGKAIMRDALPEAMKFGWRVPL